MTTTPFPSDASATRETLRGGQAWSRVLGRGTALTIADPSGRAAVAVFLFSARQPLERYNMPDTVKAQHTAFITAGRALFSDMGRVMASVTADSRGWHDTITGHLDAAGTIARYGDDGGYQARRNDRRRNTRDNALVEFAKHGLGERDLHANLNLFVELRADDGGRLRWVPSRGASSITLRCEMDLIVVMSNTPHPNDPSPEYAPPPVELSLARVPPPALDDPCRVSRPECARGFALTERLLAESAS